MVRTRHIYFYSSTYVHTEYYHSIQHTYWTLPSLHRHDTYHGIKSRSLQVAVAGGADVGLLRGKVVAMPQVGGVAADLGGQVPGVAALLEKGAQFTLLGRKLALGRGARQAGTGALGGREGTGCLGTGRGTGLGRRHGRRASALVGKGASSAFLATAAGSIVALLVTHGTVDCQGRGKDGKGDR